ncbi:hypothetical protein [Sediminibacillus sp. JSM 1682029]|uniref:hypothetical protein n=1 Tax=Sediminibacillus sp. JSM 1682029 TaxID=3229857 RepID=UPI003525EEC6
MEGYENLTDQQRAIFARTHVQHQEAMGLEKSKEYGIQNVKELRWDDEENCLKVYFANGDWWHYTPNGQWY